jgi:hypothetical protein
MQAESRARGIAIKGSVFFTVIENRVAVIRVILILEWFY